VTAALLALNRRTFASLRHRNYRLFFTGQVISVTGTWMQRVAQAWLVLQLTRSPVAVGILALAQFLPFSVFGLFAGVVVDRLDPRRLVVATQAASMALAALLAGLTLSGLVVDWQVYAIGFVSGTVQVLDAPARQALTFRMVGRRELPNAVALNSGLFNGARVFGPGVGGLVIAAVGPGVCFALNAASFLAVLVGLFLIRPQEFSPVEAFEPPRMLAGIRESLAYVLASRRALVVLSLVAFVSFFAVNNNVLLPVLAKRTLESGPGTFGLLSAFFGVGAFVGALASATLGRASLRVALAGAAGFGALQLLLAPERSLAAVLALLLADGICFTLWSSNSNSLLQLEAPSHLRGRVVGLFFFAFVGTGSLGGIVAGSLASSGGTELAFAVGGVGAVVAVLAAAIALGARKRLVRRFTGPATAGRRA